MTRDLNLGMVGLDTSHVTAFARLLMKPDDPHHVPGARIMAAVPGGTQAFSLSRNRVAGFTAELCEQYGIRIVDRIEDLDSDLDAFLLMSVDGRQHPEQLEALAAFGKPVFVDKPFACSAREARAMAALAARRGIRLASSSSIAFSDGLRDLVPPDTAVHAAEAFGPMTLLEDYPSYYWYGVHSVHLLYALMGSGCREVRTCHTPGQDVITGTWSDGRLGTVRGCRFDKAPFGATVFTSAGVRHGVAAPEPPAYAALLRAILPFLRGEPFPVPLEQTVEAMVFLEAAEKSRQAGGAAVALADLD
jgi:hypothetical protein